LTVDANNQANPSSQQLRPAQATIRRSSSQDLEQRSQGPRQHTQPHHLPRTRPARVLADDSQQPGRLPHLPRRRPRKTASTWHRGRFCEPHGSTPATHIFKLALGLIGERQLDMRHSLENEWLCAQLLREYGMPVAACEVRQFGDTRALVVERFDRRLHPSKRYWLRLPQEDFCQATATPSSRKYEAEGGPDLRDIARILQGSDRREADLATPLRSQLLFWMLAAIDGHAKNFSIHLLAQAASTSPLCTTSSRRSRSPAPRPTKSTPTN
jgi:serine/threonine protein kinase HipA of HipAB toxin-antitoxin module